MNLINLINETIINFLNENPDNIVLPSGERIDCMDSDAYPFIVDDKNINNVFVGNAGQFHGSFEPDIRKMGYRIGYKGRIWLNYKIITFWHYPQEHELNKILIGLEDALRDEQDVNVNILNDIEYKIEVYDKYIDDDGNWRKKSKLVPLKHFKGEDYEAPQIDHLLNQAEKERLRKVGERKAYNTIYHNKRMAAGTKSDSAAEYRFAKEKGIAENLNEDPDSLIINPNNDEYEKEIRYYDNDAYAFMYVDGILLADRKLSHSNLIRFGLHKNKLITPDDIKKKIQSLKKFYRNNPLTLENMILIAYEELTDEIRDSDRVKYDGRLWTNHKVISFWKYPETKTILFNILKDLEQKLKIPIINNGYKIETIMNSTWGEKIPIEDYGVQHNKNLDRKPHEISDLQWQQMGGKKSPAYNTQYLLGRMGKIPAKFKFAKERGIAENEEDYRGEHQAPNKDDSPMYDVTNVYGEDIYGNMETISNNKLGNSTQNQKNL